MKKWILQLVVVFQAHPYVLVFFGLLACGLGLPLPEEFFLVMSGYVSYRNHVLDIAGLLPMIIVTWAGVATGDLMVFCIGRKWGSAVFESRFVKRMISASGRAKAEQFLTHYGNKTILAARFLPGIRTPTFLLCGSLKVPLMVFLLFDGIAMAVSVPAQVVMTWHYGSVLENALREVARMNQIFIVVGSILVLFMYYRIHSGKADVSPAGNDGPPGEPGS